MKTSETKSNVFANSDEGLSGYVRKHLKKNKIVKKALPGKGKIHLDGRMPFLCVYRELPDKKDEGIRNLINGTASYIIKGSMSSKEFKDLIFTVGKIQSEIFHSFFFLELWSEDVSKYKKLNLQESIKPVFRVFSNDRTESDIISTLEVLKKSLANISVHKKPAFSELLFVKSVAPPKYESIISANDIKKINCHLAGLCIRPIYKNTFTGKFFPMILSSLSRQMIYALNRSFLEFTKKHTTHRAKHYFELGKRTFARYAMIADRKLAGLCDLYDFIVQISPINEAEALEEFRKNRCKKNPVFYYRPLNFNASEFKRELWNIDLEKIEDPALKNIFSSKREEIDIQISMMVNLDSPQFLYGSLQLYGNVSKKLSGFADKILGSFRVKHNYTRNKKFNAVDFYKFVTDEFKYYSMEYPSFNPEVQISKDMYSGILVSKNKLLIGYEFSIPFNRVNSLIQHEVGTHLLTYYNGLAQPFRQLHTGLSGYEELQEGLAVLSEYLSEGLTASRLRLLAARVKAAENMINGADFVEAYNYLIEKYNFSQSNAFTTVMRIYRGGGLTKDIIYLRGFLEILKYLENGGDIKPLFTGKISLSQISFIEELNMRSILKPVPLLPRYLKEKKSLKRLDELRNGFSLTSYIKKLNQQ
jgi:uncharacterized protein (TIGR02421 family)